MNNTKMTKPILGELYYVYVWHINGSNFSSNCFANFSVEENNRLFEQHLQTIGYIDKYDHVLYDIYTHIPIYYSENGVSTAETEFLNFDKPFALYSKIEKLNPLLIRDLAEKLKVLPQSYIEKYEKTMNYCYEATKRNMIKYQSSCFDIDEFIQKNFERVNCKNQEHILK